MVQTLIIVISFIYIQENDFEFKKKYNLKIEIEPIAKVRN